MNQKTLSSLLGMLLTGSLTGQVPIAVTTAFSVGEAGPPATGNVLSAVPVIRSYDFDLNGNDGASPDGWVDTLGTSAPGDLILPDNALVEGGRGTGGFFNAVGDQDAAHPSLVMSSPPFQLQTDLSISFQITSGQGTANVPANPHPGPSAHPCRRARLRTHAARGRRGMGSIQQATPDELISFKPVASSISPRNSSSCLRPPPRGTHRKTPLPGAAGRSAISDPPASNRSSSDSSCQ